jgi:hypothetical protein
MLQNLDKCIVLGRCCHSDNRTDIDKPFVVGSIFTVRIPSTCSDHQYDPQESLLSSFNPIF